MPEQEQKQSQQQNQLNLNEIVNSLEIAQNEATKWSRVANTLSKCATLVNSLIEQQNQARQQQNQTQQPTEKLNPADVEELEKQVAN